MSDQPSKKLGSRRGDFSRVSPVSVRDTAVHLQQGRILLDSDWNQAFDLLHHHLEISRRDGLGTGAPVDDPGFEVRLDAAIELGPESAQYLAIEHPGVRSEDPAVIYYAQLSILVAGDGTLLHRNGLDLGIQRTEPGSGGARLDWLRVEDGAFVLDHAGGCFSAPMPKGMLHRPIRMEIVFNGPRTRIYIDGRPLQLTAMRPIAGSARRSFGPCEILIGATFDSCPRFPLNGLFHELTLAWYRDKSWHSLGTWKVDADGLGGWELHHPSSRSTQDRLPTVYGELVYRPFKAWVQGGRYYLDGLLAEFDETVPFDQQPDLPSGGAVDIAPRFPPTGPAAAGLFYLDVWQREVSGHDDPALLEPALDGAVTTTRTRTIAQTLFEPMTLVGAENESVERAAREIESKWRERIRDRTSSGGARVRIQSAAARPRNGLYRAEIHHTGGIFDDETPAAELWRGQVSRHRRSGEDCLLLSWPDDKPDAIDDLARYGRPLELRPLLDGWSHGAVFAWSLGADSAGRIDLRLGPGWQDPADGGARAEGDPQLVFQSLFEETTGDQVRPEVEVRRVATFKWSRTNSVLGLGVRAVREENVRLAEMPPESVGLQVGVWVEMVDESTELGDIPGDLSRLEALDPEDASGPGAVLRPPPTLFDGRPLLKARLRIWDHEVHLEDSAAERPTPTAVLNESSPTHELAAIPLRRRWQALERGLQIRFSAIGRGQEATYRHGDYWWIATSEGRMEVDWPKDQNGDPIAVPPVGVHHHVAPLAALIPLPGGFTVRSFHQTFHPRAKGAVAKIGPERMEGPLDIETGLGVDNLTVRGTARLSRLVGDGLIGPEHLRKGSVSNHTLSGDVGVVPAGCAILGPSPTPPLGFFFTESQTLAEAVTPRWRDRLEIPGSPPGDRASVTLDGKIYVLLESGELWEYAPRANAWRSCPSLVEPRRRFAVAAVQGRLHVLGGRDDGERAVADHRSFDPATQHWQSHADLPRPCSDLAAAAVGDALHVVGGLVDSRLGRRPTAAHLVYEPVSDTWETLPSLPTARAGLAARALHGRLHVVGGFRRRFLGLWGERLLGAHLAWDHGAGRWVERAPLPGPRADLGLVEIFEHWLYAVGGRAAQGALRDVARYDPESDLWRAGPPLHEALAPPGAAAVDGDLVVFGAQRRPDQVLVESATVAMRWYVHQRGFPQVEEPSEEPPPPRDADSEGETEPVETESLLELDWIELE